MADFSLPLAVAKFYTLAQLTVCPIADEIPKVNVYFAPKKPAYITEAPSRDLTRAMQNNPDATHVKDKESKWRTIGLTEAGVGGGDYGAKFRTLNDNMGNSCIYVDEVQLNLLYAPNIYIAKEIAHLPCQLRLTRLHEQRHVAADLKLIKQYIPKIKMEILWYLRGLGPQGPYPQHEMQAQSQRILKEVVAAVKPMVQRLTEARRQRQGDIDTQENYKYENSLCPGERPDLK